MILIYILTFFILFYILSLCDINTILILILLFLLMKHYESSIYKPKDTEIKIYEFEKTKFIDKIDKERYIILMNSIKEYNRLYNKITVHELKILEDYSDLNANLVSDDVVEGTEDTMTLVNNYVDQLPVDLDKDKLKNMIKETFVEAQDSDVTAE